MKSLKDIYKLLVEEELQTIRQSNDSVDSVIDSIIAGFQQDSLAEGKLGKYFSILLEAPDDEELGMGDEEADPENTPPDETSGSEDLQSEEPAPTAIPKIDIDKFCQKVVNLYNNYQNLIDIKSIIIQRAMKNLSESGYNQNTIMEFQTILDQEFGIKITNGVASDEDEAPMAPPGMGAGAEI